MRFHLLMAKASQKYGRLALARAPAAKETTLAQNQFAFNPKPSSLRGTDFLIESSGEGGLGICLIIAPSGHSVVRGLVAGGPADENGQIKAGDALVSISGVEILGCADDTILDMLNGEPGSTVRLGLERMDRVTSRVHFYQVDLRRLSAETAAANITAPWELPASPDRESVGGKRHSVVRDIPPAASPPASLRLTDLASPPASPPSRSAPHPGSAFRRSSRSSGCSGAPPLSLSAMALPLGRSRPPAARTPPPRPGGAGGRADRGRRRGGCTGECWWRSEGASGLAPACVPGSHHLARLTRQRPFASYIASKSNRKHPIKLRVLILLSNAL